MSARKLGKVWMYHVGARASEDKPWQLDLEALVERAGLEAAKAINPGYKVASLTDLEIARRILALVEKEAASG